MGRYRGTVQQIGIIWGNSSSDEGFQPVRIGEMRRSDKGGGDAIPRDGVLVRIVASGMWCPGNGTKGAGRIHQARSRSGSM